MPLGTGELLPYASLRLSTQRIWSKYICAPAPELGKVRYSVTDNENSVHSTQSSLAANSKSN